MTPEAAARNLFVHYCCIDRLFTYSIPILILNVFIQYTHRAQSFSIKVTEDGCGNFKTQTHFYHVSLKMVSKYYQIILNIERLFFHDINGYHSKTTASLLPLFAR